MISRHNDKISIYPILKSEFLSIVLSRAAIAAQILAQLWRDAFMKNTACLLMLLVLSTGLVLGSGQISPTFARARVSSANGAVTLTAIAAMVQVG